MKSGNESPPVSKQRSVAVVASKSNPTQCRAAPTMTKKLTSTDFSHHSVPLLVVPGAPSRPKKTRVRPIMNKRVQPSKKKVKVGGNGIENCNGTRPAPQSVVETQKQVESNNLPKQTHPVEGSADVKTGEGATLSTKIINGNRVGSNARGSTGVRSPSVRSSIRPTVKSAKPIRPGFGSGGKLLKPTKLNPISAGSVINKKGLSIAVGSTISQEEDTVKERKCIEEDKKVGSSIATNILSAEGAVSKLGSNSMKSKILAETISEDIVPYQHLGQLDPKWNIPPPKENEKTMKEFCSSFKAPKDRTSSKNEPPGSGGEAGGKKQSITEKRKKLEEARKKSNDIDLGDNSVEGNKEETDARGGPLVEIINGEIVIKESSLVVGARRTTEEVDKEFDGNVVEEDNAAINATYLSFTKRQKTQHWSVAETRKFYLALRQCGTDFSTMENFFDGSDSERIRTRKQLKSKYLRENRKNPHLIDMAMNPSVQIPLDLSVFGELDVESVSKEGSSIGKIKPHICRSKGQDNKDKALEETEMNDSTDSKEETKLSSHVKDQVSILENQESVDPKLTREELQLKEKCSNLKETSNKIETQNPPADKGSKTTPSDSNEDNVNIPLAILPSGVKNKSKRPKFRAKPKAKKNKK